MESKNFSMFDPITFDVTGTFVTDIAATLDLTIDSGSIVT